MNMKHNVAICVEDRNNLQDGGKQMGSALELHTLDNQRTGIFIDTVERELITAWRLRRQLIDIHTQDVPGPWSRWVG